MDFSHYFTFLNLILLVTFNDLISTKKVQYFSVEHPKISYTNPDFFTNVTFTTKRYGRRNPIYYVNIKWISHRNFDNNLLIDFTFYEYLSNSYRRSFVEMHYKFCDLIHKDPFFGAAMKQGNFSRPCPFPPGIYNMENMTIAVTAIPRAFPFRKGRIEANGTYTPSHIPVLSGYIDFEIRHGNNNYF